MPIRRVVALAALTLPLAALTAATPDEAGAASCYSVTLLNQGSRSVQVKDPVRTISGYGSTSGLYRYVYVPSGDDVRVSKPGWGVTYTATGWNRVSAWTCSGGTYDIQRIN